MTNQRGSFKKQGQNVQETCLYCGRRSISWIGKKRKGLADSLRGGGGGRAALTLAEWLGNMQKWPYTEYGDRLAHLYMYLGEKQNKPSPLQGSRQGKAGKPEKDLHKSLACLLDRWTAHQGGLPVASLPVSSPFRQPFVALNYIMRVKFPYPYPLTLSFPYPFIYSFVGLTFFLPLLFLMEENALSLWAMLYWRRSPKNPHV